MSRSDELSKIIDEVMSGQGIAWYKDSDNKFAVAMGRLGVYYNELQVYLDHTERLLKLFHFDLGSPQLEDKKGQIERAFGQYLKETLELEAKAKEMTGVIKEKIMKALKDAASYSSLDRDE
jgi:hypothetical protein